MAHLFLSLDNFHQALRVHSPTEGHFGWFQVWAIMNKVVYYHRHPGVGFHVDVH